MGDIIFLIVMFILGIIIVIVSLGSILIKRIRQPDKNITEKIERLEEKINRLTNDKTNK